VLQYPDVKNAQGDNTNSKVVIGKALMGIILQAVDGINTPKIPEYNGIENEPLETG